MDILILAAIALFLGYRLWSVLGTHQKPISRKRPGDDENIVPIRASKPKSADKEPKNHPSRTKDVVDVPLNYTPDPRYFDEDHFLQGAEIAFRQIVQAFSMNDKGTLERLLDPKIYDTFSNAIDERTKKKITLEVDLPQIVSAEILSKKVEKNVAYVTVKFVSEQCTVTRNAKGNVIAGDPDHYAEIKDIWTFARPVDSPNPNWTLAATQVETVS